MQTNITISSNVSGSFFILLGDYFQVKPPKQFSIAQTGQTTVVPMDYALSWLEDGILQKKVVL